MFDRSAPTPKRQRGAALLLAMTIVVMVVSFGTFVYWQQWKNIQVENSERQSQQANWLLSGAIDWARLILRQDKSSSRHDHLNEAWNVPLEEAQLSSFINEENQADANPDEMANNAFISGKINDYGARLNILNLIAGGKKNEVYYDFMAKLFSLLNLPLNELNAVVTNLETSAQAQNQNNQNDDDALIYPQRLTDLLHFGLSRSSLEKLQDHIYLYREAAQFNPKTATKHKINLNTADTVVLQAAFPQVNLGIINEIIAKRNLNFFRSTNEISSLFQEETDKAQLKQTLPYLSTTSDLFEIAGQLRIDNLVINSRATVERNGPKITILNHEYLSQQRQAKN